MYVLTTAYYLERYSCRSKRAVEGELITGLISEVNFRRRIRKLRGSNSTPWSFDYHKIFVYMELL